jgi:hypothetical protein
MSYQGAGSFVQADMTLTFSLRFESKGSAAPEPRGGRSKDEPVGCDCAASWGRGQFTNAGQRECPPLEAATKQRLEKTDKTSCVLQLQ